MTDGLRIAVVAACPLPWHRGTPIRIHRLSEALAGRGHDVHVYAYHLGLRHPTAYSLSRISAVPWYRRHAPGPSLGKLFVLDPLLCRLLRRGLKSIPFDLVHAHHYEGLLTALAARDRSIPVVYDAHTVLANELPTYSVPAPEHLLRALGRWIDTTVPGRADQVVAVTDRIRDHLVDTQAVEPDRIVSIGNGVDVDWFRTRGSPSAPGPTLVYAGNLAAYQRIDLLITAFVAARARGPDLTLLIATDDDPAIIHRLAQERGVDEAVVVEHSRGGARLPELLARARLAVNPRVSCDGIPQKNLNYLAAGLPIVAFAESAVPVTDGETGRVVEEPEPSALAEAIVSLIDDPEACRRMGERGREMVRRRMSWDVRAAETEDVYRRLLDRFSSRSSLS